MAIVTNEPTRGGSLMYYCNGTYRLQQYLLDWPRKKELLNDVTELQTLEDGKLSSSQRACEFSMSIFFSGMKEESKEFLRDQGVPKPEEV